MIGFTIKPPKQKKKVKNQELSPPSKTASLRIQTQIQEVPIIKQDVIIEGVKYDDNDFPDLSGGPVKQQPVKEQKIKKEIQIQKQTETKADTLPQITKIIEKKQFEKPLNKNASELVQSQPEQKMKRNDDYQTQQQKLLINTQIMEKKDLIIRKSENSKNEQSQQVHLGKQIQKIDDIDKVFLILEEDNFFDFGDEEKQSDKLFELYNQTLKFKNPKVKELFFLLLNNLKKEMFPFRDQFKNEEDYLKNILPLFCNESFANIKSASEDMVFRLRYEQAAVPLRYAFDVDKKETCLGKYLVLNGIEGTYDHEQIDEQLLWKRIFYTEYLEFKEQNLFVVQIFIPQNNYKQGDLDHVDILAVLMRSKEKKNKKDSLFVPWNERNINALKIPNIHIRENNFFFPNKSYDELLEGYMQLNHPNFDELYPYQFLGYLNPIYNPTTYLIELNSILEIAQKPIFQFIKIPSKIQNKTGVSEKALNFGKSIQQTCNKFFLNENINSLFNQSQKNAIINSCDYTQPISLINGPPGTGKTFTSLGIMSIVIEHSEVHHQNGIILACAHSNTVINDWVRKIAFKPKNQLFQGNSLFTSQGQFKKCKIIRIGVADKCDPDIYDYCLDIETQRKFFDQKLQQFTKEQMIKIFDEQNITKCLTITHVKKKIQQINQQILELKLQQFYDENRSKLIERLKKDRNELYEIYKLFKQLIDEEINDYRTIQYEILEDAQIIVSTLTSSASSILKGYLTKNNLSVNLCIIDEAPQCFEPSTLIPLSSHNINKLVLIGDCKQLGPIILDQTNTINNKFQRSFYERLLDNQIQDYMLNIQYRQLPMLSEFTSKFFYENRIQDGLNIKNKQLPQYLKGVVKQNKIFLFFDSYLEGMQSKSKNSYENYLEAQAIVSLLKYLTQRVTQVNEQIISVISPYKAQVKLLKALIQSQLGVKNVQDFIEVCTVDSFQVFDFQKQIFFKGKRK